MFQEIIEKSKAWDAQRQQVKELNEELKHELDDEFPELLGMLDFNRKKLMDEPVKKKNQDPTSYEEIAHSLKTAVRQAPVKQVNQLTEHEQAVMRKKKLLEAHEAEQSTTLNKREAKKQSKREQAIERHVKEAERENKHDKKAIEAAKLIVGKSNAKHAKGAIDSELESDNDENDESEGSEGSDGSNEQSQDDSDEEDGESYDSEDQEDYGSDDESSESEPEVIQKPQRTKKH